MSVSEVSSKSSVIKEYFGLSTDTKPTKDPNDPESTYPPNSSIFYEMDKAAVYMFDADSKSWIKQ